MKSHTPGNSRKRQIIHSAALFMRPCAQGTVSDDQIVARVRHSHPDMILARILWIADRGGYAGYDPLATTPRFERMRLIRP